MRKILLALAASWIVAASLIVADAPAQVTNPQTNASQLSAGTMPDARLPAGIPGVLGSLRGANFNTTADQAIAIAARITAFQVTGIVVTNCSANLTTSVGGFYPTTAKGGTAIVANTQVFTALTTSAALLGTTISAGALITRYAISNVYLSLTVAQGGAATCDVYVVGVDLT